MPLLFLMSIDTKKTKETGSYPECPRMHKSKIFEHLELRVGE